MKKLIGTLCLFIVSVYFAQAQYVDFGRAMISYKDGSIFHGEILSKNQNEWTFELSTGDTIHLDPIQIDHLLSESEANIFSNNKYHIKTGLFLNSSFMFHAGGDLSVQWDGTLGYRFADRWDAGIGLGISGHEMDLGNDWVFHEFVNVYGYGRFFLNKNKMRLYLDSKLGLGIPYQNEWLDEDYSGGFFLQPGVGILFSSKGPCKWNIGLSQYILNTQGNTTSFGQFGNPIDVNYNVWYNRTVLQIGMSIELTASQLRRHFSLF